MLTVQADTLTFNLPQSWQEVSLSQALAIFAGADSRQTLLILSGKTEADFRPLHAPDLFELVSTHLRFLSDLSVFQAHARPNHLTINGKRIVLPTNIGTQTTIAQKWDIDDELKELIIPESEPLHVVARTLLSVYLAPLITNQPYTDFEQAKAVLPLIDSLPSTDALAVAGFFLTGFLHPTPSGTVSFRPQPPPTMRWRGRLKAKWQALRFFRITSPSAS